MIKLYSFLLLVLCSLAACKTASKAYDQGDYANAIELAIKKLQKDPGDGETKALLKNAYRFALDTHEDKIRILNGSSDETRYEQIYFEYRTLQNFYTRIKSLPSLTSYIQPTDYSTYVETFRTKAAQVYVEKGKTWMDKGSKADYRQAHAAFKKALSYNTGDKETEELVNEAYQLAVVNIIVLPLDQQTTGYNYTHASNLRSFETDLVRNLRNGNNSQYVRYYTEWEAQSKDLTPDELLELRLGRMDIGRPYDNTQSRTVST
jgi:tetratricopeptide (TPR) repeat protein